MSYDYDWCGHAVDTPDARPCGAPIERWSREWKHRRYELDAEHKAEPAKPVGPMDEALLLRADRYAATLVASVAADERIAALTELVRQHEFYRTQAEQALAGYDTDPQIGTVYSPTGPEPEEINDLLCLTTGQVFRRRKFLGGSDTWVRAQHDPGSSAMGYVWPIQDAGPFIAWQHAFGFDQVLKQAAQTEREFDALHRSLYGEKGYRDDNGGFGRPQLADAVQRILRHRAQERYDANTKAQAVGEQLRNLRRALEQLDPDDTQQWPSMVGDADGAPILREVELIDLDKVRALLDRKDCGGEVF